VIEDAVNDDTHSKLIGMFHQVLPILLRPKIGIDLVVTLRVVRVVGASIEDWIEVDGIDPERFQVFQILVNALQVPTKIITPAGSFLDRAPVRRCIVKAPGAVCVAIGIIAAVSFECPGQRQHRSSQRGSPVLALLSFAPVAQRSGKIW
jgi:hypothetical protein